MNIQNPMQLIQQFNQFRNSFQGDPKAEGSMMDKIREMLCKELEMISDRGNISMSDLSMIKDITSAVKNIDTIKAMSEAGGVYSDDEKEILKQALMILER